ncbi:MAG: glycosyltransferase family 39 protein [Chloroflexi bacterium]|nr:glycosyltransferase family 39 protein [Chloroflexota bacterium]
MNTKSSSLLLALLASALLIRLIYGLSQDPLAPFEQTGGDSWWYLVNGDALVTGRIQEGSGTDVSRLPTPPGYLVLVGLAQAVFGPTADAVMAIRVVQAVLSTLIVWCGWRMAFLLSGREVVGGLAALILTASPAFIIEPAMIASETLYMTLVALGLTAYVEAISVRPENSPVSRRLGMLALAAVAFGLAALTRAPILLFPVALALHLLIVYGLRGGWRRVVVLLVVYAAVVSTWTLYSAARWGRFVIAADGFAAFLYVGATGWQGPQAVDERLGSSEGGASNQQYIEEATATITADLGGYVRRRVTELAESGLQPHGTAYFSGPSLRDLAMQWLREDRSPGGLIDVVRGEFFLQKALLYVFHYGAILFGLVGLWRTRSNWRISLVLLGFIAYTLVVHLFLLALPRYLFPTLFCWTVLATAALPRWNRRTV